MSGRQYSRALSVDVSVGVRWYCVSALLAPFGSFWVFSLEGVRGLIQVCGAWMFLLSFLGRVCFGGLYPIWKKVGVVWVVGGVGCV